MTRLAKVGLGAVAVLGSMAVAGQLLGSTPEVPTGGPLTPCGGAPNCARVRSDLEAAPDDVRAAARRALEDVDADQIRATDDGWTAISRVGPFTDDLEVAVEARGTGSVLWVRSSARVGRSDLGVNARRVRHVVEATRRHAG